MPTRICIDVDQTLINDDEKLNPHAIQSVKKLRDEGYELILWSATGHERARSIAEENGLTELFHSFGSKPDIFIDDEPACLERAEGVQLGQSSDWDGIPSRIRTASNSIEKVCSWFVDLPDFIRNFGTHGDPVFIRLSTLVWTNRKKFLKWPKDSLLLWDGCKRKNEHSNKRCYVYPKDLEHQIRAAGLDPDTRSNGPAIISFRFAGGVRPTRNDLNWGWPIHHIYDGRYSAHRNLKTLHASNSKEHFTHSAGLVAAHPLAHSLAGDCAYFAWLLRFEAFKRFKYDPDGVFTKS